MAVTSRFAASENCGGLAHGALGDRLNGHHDNVAMTIHRWPFCCGRGRGDGGIIRSGGGCDQQDPLPPLLPAPSPETLSRACAATAAPTALAGWRRARR